MQSSGATTSLWMATTSQRDRKGLDRSIETEVCIIGAGISGISTALALVREGRSVVLIDDGPLLDGETIRTTAHLSNHIDDGLALIERLHGTDGLRLAVESHGAAIDRIEQWVQELNISCDFERLDGYLFAPPGESDQILRDELEAAQRAGISSIRRLDRAPIPDFNTGPALCISGQGQFHPGRYLMALVAEFERLGGQAFTYTAARNVDGQKGEVELSNHALVHAEHIIVATNTPVNDAVVIHTKQAPYRTYAIAARVPRGAVERALFWDTADPYHYVRIQPMPESKSREEYDLLVVGGEDHKTGQAADAEHRFKRLESWARERWPRMSGVDYRWSGQVMETIDGLAYIGRNPRDNPNVYVATGDSGHGMTHGTLAGMIIPDLIAGRTNPWAQLYDPARKSLRAAGDYLKENLNVAAQYLDYVKPGEVSSEDEILPNSGAILRRGKSLIAVHRDESGRIHERSAVCPHMGCIVQWNSQEQSWDCPCHGSRFTGQGEILCGPTISELGAAPRREETPASTG